MCISQKARVKTIQAGPVVHLAVGLDELEAVHPVLRNFSFVDLE